MNKPTVSSTVTYRKFSGFLPQSQRFPTVSSTVTPTISSTVSRRKLNGDAPLSLRCRGFLIMFYPERLKFFQIVLQYDDHSDSTQWRRAAATGGR
jgi:hypothetical protein